MRSHLRVMASQARDRWKRENEQVRVYYFVVPPRENTKLRQHVDDDIYVSLGPSDIAKPS